MIYKKIQYKMSSSEYAYVFIMKAWIVSQGAFWYIDSFDKVKSPFLKAFTSFIDAHIALLNLQSSI